MCGVMAIAFMTDILQARDHSKLTCDLPHTKRHLEKCISMSFNENIYSLLPLEPNY